MTRFEYLKQIDNVDDFIKYMHKHDISYTPTNTLKQILDVYTHMYGYLLDRTVTLNF